MINKFDSLGRWLTSPLEKYVEAINKVSVENKVVSSVYGTVWVGLIASLYFDDISKGFTNTMKEEFKNE